MNSVHFEHSDDRKYPAIELDMTNFIDHLSEEYFCQKVDIRNGGVPANTNIIDCKTENCTDFGDISSENGLKQEREVKIFKIRFALFIL